MRQQPLTHWSMPTHAASLSPYQVPLSHPSAHPTPSNLPSLFGSLTLSLSPSLALFLTLSLFPSLIPPGGNLFLSRARRSLSLYLPPEPTSLPLATATLFLSALSLSRMLLFPLDPFAVWLACWTSVGRREPSIDLSNPDLIGFLRYGLHARAYIFSLLSRA